MTPLREDYLTPVCRLLFPDWGGGCLDSHRAFTVHYQDGGDLSLSNHYDNAEITLNVCLGKDFDEGSLFFGKMRHEQQTVNDMKEVEHSVTHGVLHRGQHMHGAMPVQDGERINMIIWMRSSAVRNTLCPMCDQIPELVPSEGFGDGFTTRTTDVCDLL